MMPLVWSTEIVAGLMLLSGILVPIALLLLAPVVVNIALFHALLAPAGGGPAALVIGLHIFLAWEYRRAFEPLFVLRAGFGRPRDLVSVKKQAA
jgi:putative oxidoreductase